MLRRREAARSHPRQDAQEGHLDTPSCLHLERLSLVHRSGSTRATLFFCLCASSKTTRRTSSRSTLCARLCSSITRPTNASMQSDEARNLKAYGELPETAKINETDTFGPEDVSGRCSPLCRIDTHTHHDDRRSAHSSSTKRRSTSAFIDVAF